jgi:hypothetical protein
VDPANIVPITLDRLTAEQRDELEQMMSNVKNKFMDSFQETRRGTIVQKYKLKVVAADEVGPSSSQGDKGTAIGSGDKSDIPQDGTVDDLGADDNQEPLQFNNFQDRINYAVQHALINQSGVLVNTLTNMVKTVVDGSIAEHQASGPDLWLQQTSRMPPEHYRLSRRLQFQLLHKLRHQPQGKWLTLDC